MLEKATACFSNGKAELISGDTQWMCSFSNLFVIRGVFSSGNNERIVQLRQKLRWFSYEYRLCEDGRRDNIIRLNKRHSTFDYYDETNGQTLHFSEGSFFFDLEGKKAWGEVHRVSGAGILNDKFEFLFYDEELLLPAFAIVIVKEINRRNPHF